MKHHVPHHLDHAMAKKATEKAIESYSKRFEQYDPRATWENDRSVKVRFTVKGMTLEGQIELEPRQIALDLEVPFILRVFKKQAIDVIEREIRTWIAKAERGEL